MFSRKLSRVKSKVRSISLVDENSNLENGLSENNEYIFQSFMIGSSRKRLRRLKEIAAYNVGQCLRSDSDIEHLNLPQTLDVLV